MIIHPAEQGTPEWLQARCGIPTASNFDRIVTPGGKVSRQREAYMHRLLAEWMTGSPEPSYQSDAMMAGYMRQPEAVKWFELVHDVTAQEVGFCYKDERKIVGCSPDGLVGQDSGIEIKCPEGTAHVAFLMQPELPWKYIPQVQGSMWVTGREQWHFLSYHEAMPPYAVVVDRDEVYQEFLSEQVELFIADMLKAREYLCDKYDLDVNAQPVKVG